MEILGSGYVIEHCISAFLKEQREKAYKAYVTDLLKAIAECVSGGGIKVNARYADLAYPPREEHSEEDAEEAADIIDRIGRKLGNLG